MTQCFDAGLSTRKCRERELYAIPISSSWFKWDEIHESERRSLPEFFEGGSYSRSPRVYKEYRDFIINKYREDPSKRLTFTDVRKCVVGDVGSLRKVFLFLEKWGLINFSVSDGKQQSEEDDGPVVIVEVGPAAGVRVVSGSSSSSSSFVDSAQAGGESAFRLPPLTSYSDAFGEWKPGSGLICGFCGGHYRSGLNESLNAGIAMCSKCLHKYTGNGKIEDDLTPNDHVDVKDQSSATCWTDTETLLLLEAVLKHGDDWDLIAQHVRTKNKLDCISRLIHLPFGDHMLGTISTKSNNANLITPLVEYKPSLQVLNDNPQEFTETNGDQQVEINKVEGIETASQDHSVKRRCFPPFTDTTNSFMKQVASFSTVCGPHVAAVALDAAIKALCQENPCAKMAFETNADKMVKPVSPPYKNEFKGDIKFEDGDAKRNKQSAYVSEKSFGATTFQVRAAIATSLAAAAARAKLAADQEEREMELLMASIIQAQLKKLQYKMKHLMEIELIMEKELSYVQQMKEFVMEEWVNLLEKLFEAGIPRWRDQVFPKTLVHTFPL
ncbi:SWI/SNF complex subunit SWI3A [Dendrobium catenatum]|uniref:SWI/SNF complex subunit SWI3A n=1 Tax=Dendrobium catenatum TaxID=906689 RepID=A0A2I0VTZ3_9ASPA|nr:SWI/SNF complex subunit SWI3A [Dendrobium catenatum]PKU66881.1 SWI/SNF complex subunit SWI3A [Dendrobium catenatum]